jgi:hypothetical protein
MVGFLPYSPSSKVRCSQCGTKKSLTLFVNLESGEVFPPEFGVCDRAQKCGYSRWPGTNSQQELIKYVPEPPRPFDYLDMAEVDKRMSNKGKNHFFEFLKGLIGKDGLEKVKERYKLGTSLSHPGYVSFPQIDELGRLRQIQEVLYDRETGKRIKDKGSQRWAIEKWQYPDLNLQQCYGGLRLIKGNDKPIAIVEAAKTAIICSHFIPSYNWVSTTSLGMLNNERCKPLRGRHLVLFPDVGAEPIWQKKARHIKGMRSIQVSDYLSKHSMIIGEDIADLIIKTK